MITKGDIVVIKPEFQDAGDGELTWVARNDEQDGRLDISAVEQVSWPLWPMFPVTSAMVEATGRRIDDAEPPASGPGF